jgi:hypothetical protein
MHRLFHRRDIDLMRFNPTDNPVLGKYHEPVTGVTAMAFEAQMSAVREAMNDPVLTPEEQLERKCDWLIRELDELCALANNPETVDLVEGQALAVGQIISRAQIVGGFLNARKPNLTVVQNNVR